MPNRTELREAYKKLTDKNNTKIEKHLEHYFKGFMTLEELHWNIRQVFDSFFMFLYSHSIKWKMSGGNWKLFLFDYQAWRTERYSDISSNSLWLRHSSVSQDIDCAASADEKKLFFEIMDHLKLPIEYFEPIPAETAMPDMRIPTYGEGYITDIVDDGGLANDKEPIGKIFVLTDKLGLKTQFTAQRMGRDECGKICDYYGIGTVEGYTSSNPVTINVYLWQGKISYINVRISGHDARREHEQAFRTFPLWQKHLAWVDKKQAIYEVCVEAFLDQCKSKYPTET